MTSEDFLCKSFLALTVNETYSEASLALRDGSRLNFCHRVGERWAKAVNANGSEDERTLAAGVLAGIKMFRLNAKHLDIQFTDGSAWEKRFGERKPDS